MFLTAAVVRVAAFDPCITSDVGVRCTDGAYEITVRSQPAEPDAEAARVARFLDLLDWPRCSFDTAWLDGERGWQAQCDDGERAWVGRWWILDGETMSQAVAGPLPGIHTAAEHWFDRLAFPDRAVAAPRLR